MFDKEEELVEIGPHSYNLKPGGNGGFDYLNDGSSEHIERCKRGRVKANKVLEEKYGSEWQKILSSKSGLVGGKTSYKRKVGIFSPSHVHNGNSQTLTTEARIKRIETMKKHNHSKESKNSQYGTMWITDGFKNQKIKNDAPIPEGWRKGRKIARVAQR